MNAVFTHQYEIIATPAGSTAVRDDSTKSAHALIGTQATPAMPDPISEFGATGRRHESFFAVLLRVLAVPHI
jgi:hypothetical protein